MASVNNYAIASKDMQKDMGKILCNTNDRSNAALVPYRNHSKQQVDWENVESPGHISAPGRNSGVFGLFSGANIGGGNLTLTLTLVRCRIIVRTHTLKKGPRQLKIISVSFQYHMGPVKKNIFVLCQHKLNPYF